jgi:hypothetical protein
VGCQPDAVRGPVNRESSTTIDVIGVPPSALRT